MLLLLLIADHVPITTLMKMHRARAFLSTLRIALVGVNRPDQVPIIAAVLDCCGVYGVFIAAVSNQGGEGGGLFDDASRKIILVVIQACFRVAATAAKLLLPGPWRIHRVVFFSPHANSQLSMRPEN